MKKIAFFLASTLSFSVVNASDTANPLSSIFGAIKNIASQLEQATSNTNEKGLDSANNSTKSVTELNEPLSFKKNEKKKIYFTDYSRFYLDGSSYYVNKGDPGSLGIAVVDRVSASGAKSFLVPSQAAMEEQNWKIDLEKIEDIRSGWNFSIFLTEDGDVWVVGNKDHLFSSTTVSSPAPEKIESLSKIKRIASSGLGTHLAIDEHGVAYVWGDYVYSFTGVQFSDYKRKNIPVKIKFRSKFTNVFEVHGGFIFETQDKKYYIASTAGIGSSSQAKFEEVNINNEVIESISQASNRPGSNETFIVTESGNVYAFNLVDRGAFNFTTGSLGDGVANSYAFASQPKIIADLKGCKKIVPAMGDFFALCGNKILAWGNNNSKIPTNTRLRTIDSIPSEVSLNFPTIDIFGNSKVFVMLSGKGELLFYGRDFISEKKFKINTFNRNIYPAKFYIPDKGSY